MTTLSFRVFGVAQPKGSMRAFLRRGMKQPIVTDSNRSAKSWAQLVAHGASDALNASGGQQWQTAVSVAIRFVLPRPKALKARDVPHLKAPDLDKLIRGVLDALTGVVYRDDGQVVYVAAAKYYAQPDEAPHVVVDIADAHGTRQLFAQGA